MHSHIPVMLDTFIKAVGPISGTWVDCTLGAGNYSKALIDAGAQRVFGIDCDPEAVETALSNNLSRCTGFTPVVARFGELEELSVIAEVAPVDGIVFDLGVSSMQLDNPGRGFSFSRDGPLDMRMSSAGRSAAEIVNGESEEVMAEIFLRFGQERKARRIARGIVEHRRSNPISTTGQLASVIAHCLPPAPNVRIHPATRCFQALRIAVNDELGQLVTGLHAAERLLRAGGRMAAISFHSLEDRIVKRFIDGGSSAGASRYRPDLVAPKPRFKILAGGQLCPGADEIAANPRSRSARLRVAARTAEPAIAIDPEALGMPVLSGCG
ncbi:MAG: 16S rRNA (cytosine(1402)-N(4))-methyltransferase RsmH [Rhodobacteraceae bacterium]|nr:16S rRNA (cytosine(1402)-N(4))-methyltransferase RsmH [Paracoccaceae bacterium]